MGLNGVRRNFGQVTAFFPADGKEDESEGYDSNNESNARYANGLLAIPIKPSPNSFKTIIKRNDRNIN